MLISIPMPWSHRASHFQRSPISPSVLGRTLRAVGALFLAFLAFLPASLAQGPMGDCPERERLEAIRAAFLTEHLALTPDEAAVFWPVFNEFDDARNAIMEGRSTMKPETMSDAELTAAMKAEFQREADILALKQTYYDRFKDILPERKAAMLFMLEHRFREEVMNAMKRRLLHQGGPGGGPGSRFGGPGGQFPSDGSPRFKRQQEDQQ